MKLKVTLFAKDIAGRKIKLPVNTRDYKVPASVLGRNRLLVYTDVPLPIGGKFGFEYDGDDGSVSAAGRVARNIRDGLRRSSVIAVETHELIQAPEAIRQLGPFDERPFGLTTKELLVCALILKGWSNKDISRHLGITVDTVRHHSQNAYLKIRTVDPSIEVNSHLELVLELLHRRPGWHCCELACAELEAV